MEKNLRENVLSKQEKEFKNFVSQQKKEYKSKCENYKTVKDGEIFCLFPVFEGDFLEFKKRKLFVVDYRRKD